MSFSLCRGSLRFCDCFPIKNERSTSLPKPEFRKERYFQTNRPNRPLAIRFPGTFIYWAGPNSDPQKTSWKKRKSPHYFLNFHESLFFLLNSKTEQNTSLTFKPVHLTTGPVISSFECGFVFFFFIYFG